MKITVIGSGYVGLVAGACLADVGNRVTCADIDPDKIAKLKEAVVPFFEPGLANIVRRNLEAGRLTFTTDVAQACREGGIIFIAVGTPQGDDGSAEMRFVRQVASDIGAVLSSGENVLIDGHKIILTKSTVPVGTADEVCALIGAQAKQPFVVCSNPEFLKEGDAVNDFLKPDRIVIGAPEGEAGDVARRALKELYEPFCRTRDRVQFMDVRSSELTKYAANALLATKISFMNDLANLAERVGADIERVREGIGADPRIGYQFLFPGTGYGGSCFPKDVKAIRYTGALHGHALRVLDAVDAVNQDQKRVLLRKALRHYGEGGLSGKRFAVWGLAFKPKTDDMREAPSLELIRGLIEGGATVAAHDPEAMDNARALLPEGVRYEADHYACLDGADALFVVTEWSLFRRPEFDELERRLKARVIFDGRNLYDPARMRQRGFKYFAVGRGDALPV
ncbi:UDP-glucose/GDP-mannose dehydrogenase family protein [Myxococcota bacterium]|nr:UDP-glucose/GDP-mannose dehydrogenase family protein [Myxococcota bacterium]MBU1432094.1 UDP-glucose/GDP-mannose dehydrogenase family protein [Myxococcota bacterium]MBU1896777.1 UDP-glucose/GDP-mannose dehydrogenase family protein [Myxococcota bacterium]